MYMYVHVHVHVGVCMYVCVCERGRERHALASSTLSCFRSVSIVADGPSGPLPLTQLHCIFGHTLCHHSSALRRPGVLTYTTSICTYTRTYMYMYYTVVTVVHVQVTYMNNVLL